MFYKVFIYMKIIISESQKELIRRFTQIQNVIDETFEELKSHICDFTLAEFVTEVCWLVSDNREDFGIEVEDSADEINNTTSLIHKWVRHNFLDYIRDNFYRLIKEEGCNESYDDDLSEFLSDVE